MFRLTPVRLIYLLVGLVIGVILFFGYVSFAGVPSILPTLSAVHQAPTARPIAEFSGQQLIKVVMVNKEVTKAGATVRVNALEEYSDGFSLTYDVLGATGSQTALTLQPDQFTVTDDRGQTYRMSTLASAGTVGPNFSTGYLAFSPAIDPQVKTLTVTLPHLIIVSGILNVDQPRILDGPWQIQVPLQ